MSYKAVLRMPATAEALRNFYSWLEEAAQAGAVPPAILSRMHVAAEEAVSNVVHHGAPPEITITLHVNSEAAELTVEDTGAPFDPTTAPTPERGHNLAEITAGGWGIGLLRRFCPDVRYVRNGDANRLMLRYPLG